MPSFKKMENKFAFILRLPPLDCQDERVLHLDCRGESVMPWYYQLKSAGRKALKLEPRAWGRQTSAITRIFEA